MKKKIVALMMCVSMIAIAVVGGTLAYFTDTDYAENVMTVGNVKIEQSEWQRAENVAANATYEDGSLVPFKQNQALYPAVPTNPATDYTAAGAKDDCFKWGSFVTANVPEGGAWNGLWDETKLHNVMDKMVFVTNTGKSDCYYRTIIAFECPEGMDYSPNSDKEFMFNKNGNPLFTWEQIGYYTIDGTRYLVEVATYTEALKPNEVSRPSLLQVVMTHNATNEDAKLIGETYEILVLSQAAQTAGFDSAANALNTAFGEVTEENVISWFTPAE